MTRLPNQKNLGDIEKNLAERIDEAIVARNDMKKKQFITAAIEFFLALREDVQDQLLLRPPTSDVFTGLANQVVGANTFNPVSFDTSTQKAIEDDKTAVQRTRTKRKHTPRRRKSSGP